MLSLGDSGERVVSASARVLVWFHERRRGAPRQFWVWVILACSLAVTPVVVGYRVWWSEAVTAWGVDFKAYYLAGLRARHGVGLYDPGQFLDSVPSPAAKRFLYPPVVVLAFVPLTFLSPDVARVLWVGCQLFALSAGVVGLLWAWGVDVDGHRGLVVGWCVLGFYPVTHLARVGNVAGFQVAALCVAATALAPDARCWFARAGRPSLDGWKSAVVVAGATVAAVVAKPFVALASGHLLRRRRVLAAGGTSAFLLGVGVLAFGVDAHVAYVETVLDGGFATTNPGTFGVHYEPFRALGAAATIPRLALLAVVGATVVELQHQEEPTASSGLPSLSRDATALAVGAVAVPLVVPSTNTLELLFVLPAAALAWVGERREGTRSFATVVVAAFALVHLSQWGARVLVFVGPAIAPAAPWTAVGSVLYAVRPATVGLLAVLGVLAYRAWSPRLASVQPSHSA